MLNSHFHADFVRIRRASILRIRQGSAGTGGFCRFARLAIAAHQCGEPIRREEAERAAYRPVEIGWRWGPAWSTSWFRVSGTVPAAMAGRPVALRFSCGTEALLYDGAASRQGFDVNHETHLLFPDATGGEAVDLLIEAACNQPLGTTSFWWDSPDAHERWESPTPGRIERCELVVFDYVVWRLWQTYDFARHAPRGAAPGRAVHATAARGARRATRIIDDRRVGEPRRGSDGADRG